MPRMRALAFAALVEPIQQLVDLGQEDLGLLGAASASSPMRAIFADHSACQSSHGGLGRLERELGRRPLGPGRGELGLQLGPLLVRSSWPLIAASA